MDAKMLEALEGLKTELQFDENARNLEKLVAASLSGLLCMPIRMAKSGFQHGADAGPAGEHGRRFRVECKKYRDTSSLNERELLGEIDQAVARDSSLEAWVLVTTRRVPEQLAQSLILKGERIGVPVLILDWAEDTIGPLAAICAFDPSLVVKISKEAEDFAQRLQSTSDDAIKSLKRCLQSWCIGYESLRLTSHSQLQNIWSTPKVSNAELGQNAAGGNQKHRVSRKNVSLSLNSWWSDNDIADAPAAIIGLEGVGKTWAVLDWLVENLRGQPIVLVMPSSSIADKPCTNVVEVKKLIAGHICSVTGVQNLDHWFNRLNYLLQRPIDEGPVFTIYLDGLNQEPSAKWLSMLKTLQGGEFSGRIRIILSSRPLHFSEKLHDLRSLIDHPREIEVAGYDKDDGGELDQMLAFEGLTQNDLQGDLLELACVPRLFKLVIKLRDKFDSDDTVTVHQLLWEYGIDSFGDRAGRSFSPQEWREWLGEVAEKYRNGVHEFSSHDLSESVDRSDLSPDDVFSRLSEVVDGRFAQRMKNGKLEIESSILYHALGLALLTHLVNDAFVDSEILEMELYKWIDPIAGLDESAEVLRAAVSIFLAQEKILSGSLLGILVTAWLQTQNVPDQHQNEIASLAVRMPDALLDTIQNSTHHASSSALGWATSALRGVSRSNQQVLDSIVQRSTNWLSQISRNANADDSRRKHISSRLATRIGRDESCAMMVVGIEMEILDECPRELQDVVPKLMEGYPLLPFLGVFEKAAVALAIGDRDEFWNGIRWRCLLNELDPIELAVSLRSLAECVAGRFPESGVHPDLPKRVASHLLRLTGNSEDEDWAISLKPKMDGELDYERDYLANPGKSLFALERRHVEEVLADKTLNLHYRVQKTRDLWCDPDFEPPSSFVSELSEALSKFDFDALNSHRSRTSEDHWFEELEPAFARCIPVDLAEMLRAKMRCCSRSTKEDGYWKAISSTDYFVLATDAEIASAITMRRNGIGCDDGVEPYALNRLLMLEIRDLEAFDQHCVLIEADVGVFYTELDEILDCPNRDDVDELIRKFSCSSTKSQDDLLILLSVHSLELSEQAWDWVVGFINVDAQEKSFIALQILYRADSERLGMYLFRENWTWSKNSHQHVRHLGSGALAQCPKEIPFEQLVAKIAPWRLLETVRRRCFDSKDVQAALKVISSYLLRNNEEDPDLGADITIDRQRGQSAPFSFSISPRHEPLDFHGRLELSMDADARQESLQRAVDMAVDRVRKLQESKAIFYHAPIDQCDFEHIVQNFDSVICSWLEGLDDISEEFRRRVQLAESFYLSLCEALLRHNPQCGVKLWHALCKVIHTRYIEVAGIESLIHMVFRVPDSDPVIKLREQLLDLKSTNTDLDLYQIAIAACRNAQTKWLSNQIEQDRSSQYVWRQKRASILEGYSLGEHRLPIDNAWPEGNIQCSHAIQKRDSARAIWSNACAQHWWEVYIDASDPVDAYAAWVTFLRSADTRAWLWMQKAIPDDASSNSFLQMKLSFAQINKHKIKSSMEKRTKELDQHFLRRKIATDIYPWRA